jgi:predicted cation transporter
MTEKWIQFVEIGLVILVSMASLFAAFRLRRNAEKHEHSAEVLDEKIKQAITQGIKVRRT